MTALAILGEELLEARKERDSQQTHPWRRARREERRPDRAFAALLSQGSVEKAVMKESAYSATTAGVS